jgi:hypothetical protein
MKMLTKMNYFCSVGQKKKKKKKKKKKIYNNSQNSAPKVASVQLFVNITPNITLQLVRRLSCSVMSGQKSAKSYLTGHLRDSFVLFSIFIYFLSSAFNVLHY